MLSPECMKLTDANWPMRSSGKKRCMVSCSFGHTAVAAQSISGFSVVRSIFSAKSVIVFGRLFLVLLSRKPSFSSAIAYTRWPFLVTESPGA
ncbi:JM95 [macacine gammaherpesvirus 11]|uniref:JM95 n=2 Tax=macacine gammaherpesvirus 11 TaxID=2560570 RepID=G9JMA3_9GAMA|nr:JM95 [Macaca fuscata rhadinovirus]AAT00072.1 JM95 [Macaca fuscata rhadinovirus]AEW87620.1 JM95 [Macaca fuscata rhadinovirus]AEW87790.1 JM95 [Macaca fuscata rhadinovirus]